MNRGPPTYDEKVIFSIDRVAIKGEEARGVLVSVRTLFGSRTSHREVSSQSPAGQCCLNLLLSLIALSRVRFMPRGVLWSQHLQARSSMIYVPVEIG